MPLTKKGNKILKSMQDQYGSKKGTAIFYASKNKGTIEGVEKAKLGKAFGPPPEKGPCSQGCPYRESTSKNTYPGNNGIQIKGQKFIGVR